MCFDNAIFSNCSSDEYKRHSITSTHYILSHEWLNTEPDPASLAMAVTPEALLAMAEQFVIGLGFRYIAYSLNLSLPMSSQQRVEIDNLPVACRDGDVTSALKPVIRRCRTTLRPLVWDDSIFKSAPAFHGVLRSAGVRSGWSQVVRGSQGMWGMFTTFRDGAPLTADVLGKIEPQLVWLAQIFHHHLSCAHQPRYANKADVNLTEIEKKILRWTIDGKTTSDLAEILELSARTVNYHVQNILAKMNACNKTSAAAQAALLGLLG